MYKNKFGYPWKKLPKFRIDMFGNKKLKKLVEICMKEGLLLVYTGRESVKLGPPLTITKNAINEGCKIIEKNIKLIFKNE